MTHLTKKELIDALMQSDAPDDAYVYFKLNTLMDEWSCGSVYIERNFMGYSVTIAAE